MVGFARSFFFEPLLSCFVLVIGLVGCSANPPPARSTATPRASLAQPAPAARPVVPFPVMLGIDVLEAEGFSPLKGKRVGLLTHPAAVNRRGESTVSVLRRAPGVHLVALYGMEHGVYNELPAEKRYPDYRDPRTGLMVYSLYNKGYKAQPYQLKPIDVLVIDLQDIGTRSYTFISAMKLAIEACFEQNVEVVVLDRPNPLGGLKVDGPPLDAQWKSYVGAFRVPYVHGLTIGELARMAKEAPGVLDVPEGVRLRGKLTIVPMRGWTRRMRWPETGLPWIATSTNIQDFSAAVGYPMTGLGCYLGGFRHGVGTSYIFRGISHKTASLDTVERELKALKLPGVTFRRVSAPNREGKPAIGLFIEITDYDEWEPTALNFYLMRLACKLEPKNPFATATPIQRNGFLKHMGSTAFFNDLVTHGARVDVDAWLARWRAQAKIYREQTRRYWLYR